MKPLFHLNGESRREYDLFPHQKDAIEKLTAYYKEKDYKEELGWKPHLLVMPTGSGKTFTANSLVIPYMLEKGHKILWLSHRTMLLDQAANCMKNDFYRSSDGEDTPKRSARIISGTHKHLSTASFATDDVIISSIQSLYSQINRLPFVLKGVNKSKLVVVIDEAHHTPSNSYITVLNTIKEHVPGFKLLGLTATPTRLTESERKRLYDIFDYKQYQPTTLKKLVTQGFLSTPKPEIVKTEIEFEGDMTYQDHKHMHRFNELSERMKNKIADSKERNYKIIDTYFDRREKYGKTIIFAINQVHCQTLAKALNQEAKKRGVKGFRADYIISSDPARTEQVVEDYRNDKIDVLVNVQILTEGVDIPDTKTVFLTRPTNSETMLTQMVGRALRGAKVGGTEEAYIVDFEDQWKKLRWGKFDNEIIGDTSDLTTTDSQKKVERITIPWWLINAYYEALNMDPFGLKRSILDCRPIGWYSIGHVADSESSRLIVWENQLDGFRQIEANLNQLIGRGASAQFILDTFFFDINDPRPSLEDLDELLKVINTQKKLPPWFTFDERDQFDPHKIARQIFEDDMGPKASYEFLQRIYCNDNSIAQQLFTEFDEFRKNIEDIICIINNKGSEKETLDEAEAKPLIVGLLSKEERKNFIFDKYVSREPYPAGTLNEILDEVTEMMFKGESTKPNNITWTQSPLVNAWGWYRESSRTIAVNKLLNDNSLPKELVKFIVYHELLHCQGYMQHNNQFRIEEHKYPNWQEIEHKLAKLTEEYRLDIPIK